MESSSFRVFGRNSSSDSGFDDNSINNGSTDHDGNVPTLVGHKEQQQQQQELPFSRLSSRDSGRGVLPPFVPKKEPGFGLLNLLTLKIIFFDLLISFGDVVSDFAQGIVLINSESPSSPNNRLYGFVTIGINWLPGLVAATHLISMYRSQHSCAKILAWAALLVLFYPVVPLLAYLNLLWHRPNGNQLDSEENKEKFRQAEFKAMIAHSIAGGIESPIQFILQVWLILNGKIPLPWEDVGSVSFTDWYGNELFLPTTAAVSLLFSVSSLVKAVIEFNILRVHIQDINCGRRILSSLELIFDHLPYLASASFFRIAAVAFLLTYINAFAFVPVAAFWICCLAIGYRSFDLEKIPIWLISFIAVLLPICFTTHEVNDSNRQLMVDLQYKTFRQQSLFSVLIFVPSLCACLFLVNADAAWNYDPNVILNNLEFNVGVGVIIATGFLSYFLSFRPSWYKAFVKPRVGEEQHELDVSQDAAEVTLSSLEAVLGQKQQSDNFETERISCSSLSKSVFRIFTGLIVLLLISAPAIVPNVVLHTLKMPPVYVSFAYGNNYTKVIKAIPLNAFAREISGHLQFVADKRNPATAPLVAVQTATVESNRSLILYVRREDWKSCLRSNCYNASMAVILADGYSDSSYHPIAKSFRPSFPTTDIDVIPLPMFLVQAKDADWFFPAVETCYDKPCLVQISITNASIAQPEFTCDASESKLLPYGNESLIDPNKKLIRGNQYRTVQCRWGDRPCFGFRNAQEEMDFCDGHNIQHFFRGNGFYWDNDHQEEYKGRTIVGKVSYDDHAHGKCLTNSSIEACDNSESGKFWSKWLRCDRTNPKSIIRKRFCEINDKCQLQEKQYNVKEEEC